MVAVNCSWFSREAKLRKLHLKLLTVTTVDIPSAFDI